MPSRPNDPARKVQRAATAKYGAFMSSRPIASVMRPPNHADRRPRSVERRRPCAISNEAASTSRSPTRP